MSGQQENITDTGQGILVGVEPAQPRQAADWQQQRPDQAVSQPVLVAPQQQRPVQARWTDEDLERARQQEKEKLYGRIEEMAGSLKELQEARAAEQAERDRIAGEAAEARRLKEEGEMELRELMTRRDREHEEQMARLEARYDTDRAVFEQERRFSELAEYRRQRIEQEQEFILPELRDLIGGESVEAVDAAVETMKARTAQIWANMQAVQAPQPFQRGASPTAPPVGPLEQMPTYETLTPEDIKSMDMETYKRYRNQLLQATSPRSR